jgi:iron complex outermembrane receptor protein
LASENKSEKQINSLFGSLDLNYKNIVFLQLTGRNDWSSTLPLDANSYFYPSANASFVFTDAFDMNSNVLSFGKVRFGVAQTATDTNPYQLSPVYGVSSFLGQPTSAVGGTIPPTNLKNETSKAIEAGLDLRFFNGRAQLDLAVYDIRMSDQILNGPVAQSSGFTSKRFNQGEIQNKGIELLLTGTAVQNSQIKWDVTFNMNANRNFIISLDDAGDVDRIVFGGIFGANGPSIEARPGEEYGTITGWDYVYFDQNGNGETDESEIREDNRIIDANGQWYSITPNRTAVGNTTPTWYGGLTNTLTWKNFTLNVLLDIRQGGDIFSGTMGLASSFGQGIPSLEGRNAANGGLAWNDTYTDNGVEKTIARDDGLIKAGVIVDENGNATPNTNVVPFYYKHADQFTWGAGSGPVSSTTFEASWIRVRELSLTYNFTPAMLSNIGFLQNASITLLGRNLWYLRNTAPEGVDPSRTNGAGNVQGIEWGQMPGSRNLGFSLRASF